MPQQSAVPGRNHTCRLLRNNCAENSPELRDLLGHDQAAHRIARCLIQAGITTPEALRDAASREIIYLRGVGRLGLRLLHARGLLGRRAGHRALIYQSTTQPRASIEELDRAHALVAYARAHDFDIVGVVIENPSPYVHDLPTAQWRAAQRELRDGDLDVIVIWDATRKQPATWAKGAQGEPG
ncbi:hypothetical protein [Streptomyces sp. AP-93]|uniref:hypothetical protein n=1 Tax=Streptomyces sp. AP-93 TaxID=2929048 RepID=UPI001FB01C8E|nr:hypothetical protein [Streptomyces sp. AP-93]MCJ0875553.1 hypothetical protein [Streptomyces sp. AP-93]